MRIGIGRFAFNVGRSKSQPTDAGERSGTAYSYSDGSYAQLEAMVYGSASGGKPVVDDRNVNRSWWFAANRHVWGRGARVPLHLYLVREDVGRDRGSAPQVAPSFRARGRSFNFGPGRTQRAGQEWADIGQHPFLDLLDQPNPDEDGVSFHARQLLSLQDAGRCYVVVHPRWMEFQNPALPGLTFVSPPEPKEMRLLEWNRVRVLRSATRRAAAFSYSCPEGGVEEFRAAPATRDEREEWKRKPYPFVYCIVHPTGNTYDGANPAYAATAALATHDALSTLHWNQVAKGLHAGLIFILKGAGTDPVRFANSAILVQAGIGKAGEPLILPDGVAEVQKNPLTNADMGFAALTQATRQEMLAVQGVSDGIVGMGNPNRSVLWALEHLFATGVIDPLNELVAGAYNRWVLPLYPGQGSVTRYKCEFESARMVDETDLGKFWTGLVNGGIATANEARPDFGLAPHPDGDGLKKGQLSGSDAFGQASATQGEMEETEAGAGRASADCGCGGHAGKV